MGLVEVRGLLPYISELVAAVGHEEAARRIGCTSQNLYYIRGGKTSRVRQPTAQGILLAAWPFSTRARTRSAHGLFDSRDCAWGDCVQEATRGEYCHWHSLAASDPLPTLSA